MNKTEKSGKRPNNDKKNIKCENGFNRDEADLANAKWPKLATRNIAAMPNHHLLGYKHSSSRTCLAKNKSKRREK
jgi:hypothetical protein